MCSHTQHIPPSCKHLPFPLYIGRSDKYANTHKNVLQKQQIIVRAQHPVPATPQKEVERKTNLTHAVPSGLRLYCFHAPCSNPPNLEAAN